MAGPWSKCGKSPMSYPKDVKKFILWTRAMVAGATVGQPNYGKKLTKGKPPQVRRRKRRKHRRRSRRKNDD